MGVSRSLREKVANASKFRDFRGFMGRVSTPSSERARAIGLRLIRPVCAKNAAGNAVNGTSAKSATSV
jgi:hypothetical protein